MRPVYWARVIGLIVGEGGGEGGSPRPSGQLSIRASRRAGVDSDEPLPPRDHACSLRVSWGVTYTSGGPVCSAWMKTSPGGRSIPPSSAVRRPGSDRTGCAAGFSAVWWAMSAARPHCPVVVSLQGLDPADLHTVYGSPQRPRRHRPRAVRPSCAIASGAQRGQHHAPYMRTTLVWTAPSARGFAINWRSGIYPGRGIGGCGHMVLPGPGEEAICRLSAAHHLSDDTPFPATEGRRACQSPPVTFPAGWFRA